MAIPAIANARMKTYSGDHLCQNEYFLYYQTVLIARRYKNNVIIVSGHPLLHTQVTRKPPPSGVKEPTPDTLEYYGIVPIGEDKPGPHEPAVNWEPDGMKTLRNLPPRYTAKRWQKIADTWHWGIFPYWVTNSTFENTDWDKKC